MCPEHDPVREERVVHCAALSQKLRVGDYPVVYGAVTGLGSALLNEHRYVVPRTHRNGALIDHNERVRSLLSFRERPSYTLGDYPYMREICRTIITLRGTHADKQHIHSTHY